MKGIALILSILIFSTSLKASSFISGVSYALQGQMSAVTCCKSKDASKVKSCEMPSEEKDQNDKDGCCEGEDCNCTCCLHIAYISNYSQTSGSVDDFAEVKFDYSFQYQADYLNAVFHPPAIS